MGSADAVVSSMSIGAMVLFWVGMLGLLGRRSLVGMLVGLSFAWLSVGIGAIGSIVLVAGRGGPPSRAALESGASLPAGAALVICIGAIGCLQVLAGLALVAVRIRRRGTLDADDAALLEG